MRGLVAGTATAVGSLPHDDAEAAAELVLEVHSRLPAAPQLPMRDAREGMLVQWLRALPEVEIGPDGIITISGHSDVPPEVHLDVDAHGGLLAFVERCAAQDQPPKLVKLQVTGPLTLGSALVDAGMSARRAFSRASETARRSAAAVVGLVTERLPGAGRLLFLDEPALVRWKTGEPPLGHDEAVDVLSGVLAGVDAMVGVHVCGDGDRRLAIEAGPDIVGVEVSRDLLTDAVSLGHYLDGGGWVAWGAVPTDRPVGEQAEHWWRQLVSIWCDLTRAGCDPVRLRTQSLITPACGLARHGVAQAEQLMRMAVEIGERVREQAIATRLSAGA